MILKAPARFGTPADEGHGRGKGMGYSAGANLRSQRQASFWNDRVRTWLIPTVSFRYVDCKKETEITMPSAPNTGRTFPHIGTISEITRLTSECGYILNQYLLQKFFLKVLFQCESNLQ